MRVLVITLLLGLSACANSERCPPRKDLYPCSCENMADTGTILVQCSDSRMDLQMLNKSMRGLVGKRNVELELEDLYLGKIPSNFFEGIGIIKLDIIDCELYKLTDDESVPPLLGLEDSLRELDIRNSFKVFIAPFKLDLGHLRKLRTLELNYNNITELDDNWFGNSTTQLRYLILDSNDIEKLGPRSFANFVNLKKLIVAGNLFETFNRTMLPTSTVGLRLLDLSFNELSSLPEDMFIDMPNLEDVLLVNNYIGRIEQKTWEPIWEQLDEVDLHGNPLECDDHMEWLFKLKSPKIIYGQCESPDEVANMSLKRFIRRGRQEKY